NYFHLLRRHVLSDLHRPLVVFSPKSMLRNKMAASAVEDFTNPNKFRSVIDDPNFESKDKSGIKTLLLCSGKIYWELEKKRKKDKRDDIAIARLEMLHPLPHNRLRDLFESYPDLEEVRWVQDEPANQGPWPFLALNLPEA
ncbi:hypothetical protein QP260_22805, partial [Escherichia coli]|nr:hypothetical protein [Escherichia coli]